MLYNTVALSLRTKRSGVRIPCSAPKTRYTKRCAVFFRFKSARDSKGRKRKRSGGAFSACRADDSCFQKKKPGESSLAFFLYSSDHQNLKRNLKFMGIIRSANEIVNACVVEICKFPKQSNRYFSFAVFIL